MVSFNETHMLSCQNYVRQIIPPRFIKYSQTQLFGSTNFLLLHGIIIVHDITIYSEHVTSEPRAGWNSYQKLAVKVFCLVYQFKILRVYGFLNEKWISFTITARC